jgi:hypothetical protein
MAYYGVMPTVALIALPWVLLVHIMFTLSFSLLLAMGNLFISRREVFVRARHHDLDVRQRGAIPRQPGRKGSPERSLRSTR